MGQYRSKNVTCRGEVGVDALSYFGWIILTTLFYPSLSSVTRISSSLSLVIFTQNRSFLLALWVLG